MFNGKHVENYSHFSFPPLTSIKKKKNNCIWSPSLHTGVLRFFC